MPSLGLLKQVTDTLIGELCPPHAQTNLITYHLLFCRVFDAVRNGTITKQQWVQPSRFLSTPNCPIKRSDICYCSKLQSNNGYGASKRSIEQSLEKCGLEYIDLYLIHSPYGGKKRRLESWKAIEEAKDQGLIRSIGVSNYGKRHIEELLEAKPKYRPTVNQCDLHPFMARLELVEYCRSEDIALEVSPVFAVVCRLEDWEIGSLLTKDWLRWSDLQCWGPLVRAERFDHPAIVGLAKKHSVTPAQVLM